MVTYRIDRINKEFLRAISELLRSRVKNEEVKEAMLTMVSVSRDLGYAKVFYTLIDESRKDVVQKSLESTAGLVRSILGREMHLRTVPELHFFYDDSETKARKMDELLDSIMPKSEISGESSDDDA